MHVACFFRNRTDGKTCGIIAGDGVCYRKHYPQSFYVSPNHQEFGFRIGSPMFKARSPLTHLITVQMTHQSKIRTSIWPAPGSADTELGVLMEPEVSHGKAEVYTRVQA